MPKHSQQKGGAKSQGKPQPKGGAGKIPPVDGTYWKAVLSDQGDAANSVIFASVGRALSYWESVETEMSGLFALLMSAEYSAASRVFGTIFSARGRREALEAAAEVHFWMHNTPEEWQANFKNLLDHYMGASSRRGEIAHGAVYRLEVDAVDRGFLLMPPQYNTLKNKVFKLALLRTQRGMDAIGGKYRYTSADVDRFSDQFGELARWAIELHRSLPARRP